MDLRTETERTQKHFDQLAPSYDDWKQKNAYYSNTLKAFIKRHVREGSRVLEIGCGTGEFLHATRPGYGLGIDISGEMINRAASKFPQYTFIHSSIEHFNSDEKFDYIVVVDLLHHVYDIQEVLNCIHRLCHPQTRIIATWINPWWEPFLRIAEIFKLKIPEMPLNYLERRNINELLQLTDFSSSQMGCLLLMPKFIPFFSFLCNTLGVRLPILNKLAFVQHIVFTPLPKNQTNLNYGCSVVIPCHNEEGNIQEAIRRVPAMGKGSEIIVVNDGSKDKTADKVRELQADFPNLKLVDYSLNRGKGHAIVKGFEAATQEIVMILDADMTVEPEELPRFFEALNKGLCQFVNGSRLVYPMENQSMRFCNHLGNKIFCRLLSFITNQNLTDTLCGTKALYRRDIEHFTMGRDNWGDYDLIFGAARLGNKILEIPIHYKQRKSGESKMRAFQHGLHLLKASWWGFKDVIFASISLQEENKE